MTLYDLFLSELSRSNIHLDPLTADIKLVVPHPTIINALMIVCRDTNYGHTVKGFHMAVGNTPGQFTNIGCQDGNGSLEQCVTFIRDRL